MSDGADTDCEIFISYSHRDTGTATELFALLKAVFGEKKIWMDPRLDTEALGKPYAGEIKQALDHAWRVIVLWSHNSKNSVWVEDEANRAENQKKYLPLNIDGVPPEELPMPFSRYHTIRVENLRAQMPTILDAMGAERTAGTRGGYHLPSSAADTLFPKFPRSGAAFVGRRKELDGLFSAWDERSANIIALDAAGGTGKTAIANKFSDEMAVSGWRGARKVFGWSFDSQGTDEKRQGSAAEFFDRALEFFGNSRESFGNDNDRGAHLATLIRRQRALLILDGIEPLQYPAGRGRHDPNAPLAGRIRDVALSTMLDNLARDNPARDNPGLVLITTRVEIQDLTHDERLVRHIKLQPLPPGDAVALLRAMHVEGSDEERLALAREFDYHALTLSLLAPYIVDFHAGQIPTIQELRRLFTGREGSPAFRVMRRYEILFEDFVADETARQKKAADRITGQRQLALLRLLGLFDEAAPWSAIEVVLQGDEIPGLTGGLGRVTPGEWQAAIRALQALGLINRGGEKDEHGMTVALEDRRLDAHPLVREYFGPRLKETNEAAYKQANRRLFEHYRWLGVPDESRALAEQAPMWTLAMLMVFLEHPDHINWDQKELAKVIPNHQQIVTQFFPGLPLEPVAQLVEQAPREQLAPLFPATLDKMMPLFAAIAHGARAGRIGEQNYTEAAWNEVYNDRIRRGDSAFILKKLGAYSADLAALAHFFAAPWADAAADFLKEEHAPLFNYAAFSLRALGRLAESLVAEQAALALDVANEDWRSAAQVAGNVSELRLALGQLDKAITSAGEAVAHADRQEDSPVKWQQQRGQRTTLADALHQAGRLDEAEAQFKQAEALQEKRQPTMPRLYSLPGVRYADLLLSRKRPDKARERASSNLELYEKVGHKALLDFALDSLTLGRAALLRGDLDEAHLRLADEKEGALARLRQAGHLEFLPRGLLALAACHRLKGDYPLAAPLLRESIALCRRAGMRLFLADSYLENARLALAIGGEKNLRIARNSATQAASLINMTGYHRRAPELADLQQQLA